MRYKKDKDIRTVDVSEYAESGEITQRIDTDGKLYSEETFSLAKNLSCESWDYKREADDTKLHAVKDGEYIRLSGRANPFELSVFLAINHVFVVCVTSYSVFSLRHHTYPLLSPPWQSGETARRFPALPLRIEAGENHDSDIHPSGITFLILLRFSSTFLCLRRKIPFFLSVGFTGDL